MSEKRKKFAVFCLKLKAKRIKVELFDADQWADGEPECVRARIDGRWHDTPDGSRLWLDAEDVARLIQSLLLEDGQLPAPPPVPERPVLRYAQPVSLPCGPYTSKGEPLGMERGRILSEDAVLGHDGRWYVVVGGVTRRTCLEAYDNLRVISGQH
ncbi:MAG: hypothetical protein IJD16_09135 [Desulfovibrio sp.]|nr:hypothetical protein [Desulfovibrio sp.]